MTRRPSIDASATSRPDGEMEAEPTGRLTEIEEFVWNVVLSKAEEGPLTDMALSVLEGRAFG